MPMRRPLRLPGEQVPAASWRTVVQTVAVSAALLVVANLATPMLELKANRTAWLLSAKWALLDAQTKPVEMLVLGDSSGNQSAIPSVLSEKLSVRALNLCTFGWMTVVHDAWLLDEHLRKLGPPRAVVVVNVHDIWYRPFALSSAAGIPRPWGFWEDFQPRVSAGVRSQLGVAVRRYFPLALGSFGIRRLVQHPVETLAEPFGLDREGFMPVWRQSDLQEQTSRYVAFARDHQFEMDPLTRTAVAQVIDRSNQHGFPVYWVNAPIYNKLLEAPEFRRYSEARNQALMSLLARGKQAHLIFREPMALEADQLESVDHPNPRGAQIFTERLADEISRLTAAAR
jgi:hypothetical protein